MRNIKKSDNTKKDKETKTKKRKKTSTKKSTKSKANKLITEEPPKKRSSRKSNKSETTTIIEEESKDILLFNKLPITSIIETSENNEKRTITLKKNTISKKSSSKSQQLNDIKTLISTAEKIINQLPKKKNIYHYPIEKLYNLLENIWYKENLTVIKTDNENIYIVKFNVWGALLIGNNEKNYIQLTNNLIVQYDGILSLDTIMQKVYEKSYTS